MRRVLFEKYAFLSPVDEYTLRPSNVEHNSKVVDGGIFGTKIVTYMPLSDVVSGYV